MEAGKFLPNREFAVIAQIGQAVALPSKKDYLIKVTLGGFELDFKPLPQKNPSNYKRYGRCEQTAIQLPYADIKDFGKVIVQLMDGDDPVCYYIEPIENFE